VHLSSQACAGRDHLIHVPSAPAASAAKGSEPAECGGEHGGNKVKGGGGGAAGRSACGGDEPGEVGKAAAMCEHCGLYVCGVCTWKARKLICFHAPLSCKHRVAVDACVARVQSAMDELDQKRAAAASNSRRAGVKRPSGAGAGGELGRSDPSATNGKQEEAPMPLRTGAPTLAEMIELLCQLGRTSEVATLREIEAGTYQPPATANQSNAEDRCAKRALLATEKSPARRRKEPCILRQERHRHARNDLSG
jgi:hypothetical protein